jgi:hypothetical protein
VVEQAVSARRLLRDGITVPDAFVVAIDAPDGRLRFLCVVSLYATADTVVSVPALPYILE